ncbi:hypothetical protein [Streptomyces sp. NPDC059597]|uniref:hypothetical protein n=1 Tax=Streptomyces sp. NPDC059597 TaxID=3346879 RepID=UPI00368213E8
MTSPLTDQQIADAETAITGYRQHPDLGFACCSAHPAADAAAVLLAEVRRLRAALDRMRAARDVIASLHRDLADRLNAVTELCDAAEKQATRWERPLPVPEWVAEVRRAAAPADRSAV